MEFEWDENKNRRNIEAHGISFQDAIPIFFDDFRIELDDTSSNEERFNVIGMAQGRILTVVYTWRGANIRIISVRKAEKYEEREYYNYYR